MNDLERQLKEALQRESAKAPLLEDLPKPVRTRARRRRAGQTTGGALLSVVLLAGIALPLRAMWPLADHDKTGQPGAGVAAVPAIVYERLTDNDFDLVLWSQDGQTRPLIAAPGYQGYPSWSPDGTRVAYVAGTEPKSDITQVAIIDVATGAITRVTPPSDSMDDSPAWSPDGNRLAFSRIVTGGSDAPGIYVVNSDGTELRSLTDQAGDARPTWSPDGRSILFDRSINDSTDFWTLDVATGRATQLTHSGAINGPMGGQYSPDGTQIAYSVVTVDRANLVQRDPVFVIPADRPTAARQVAVTVPGGRFDWTPDGRHLIVAAPDPSREPSGSHQPAEFTAVDINTGETTPLGVQVDYAGGRLDWNPQVPFELSTGDQSPAPGQHAESSTGSVVSGSFPAGDPKSCPEQLPSAPAEGVEKKITEKLMLTADSGRWPWEDVDASTQALFASQEDYENALSGPGFDLSIMSSIPPGSGDAVASIVEGACGPGVWRTYFAGVRAELLRNGDKQVVDLFFVSRPEGPKLWLALPADPNPSDEVAQNSMTPEEAASVEANATAMANELGLEIQAERPQDCNSFVEIANDVTTGYYRGVCLDKLSLDIKQRWELGRALRGMPTDAADRRDFQNELDAAGEANDAVTSIT